MVSREGTIQSDRLQQQRLPNSIQLSYRVSDAFDDPYNIERVLWDGNETSRRVSGEFISDFIELFDSGLFELDTAKERKSKIQSFFTQRKECDKSDTLAGFLSVLSLRDPVRLKVDERTKSDLSIVREFIETCIDSPEFLNNENLHIFQCYIFCEIPAQMFVCSVLDEELWTQKGFPPLLREYIDPQKTPLRLAFAEYKSLLQANKFVEYTIYRCIDVISMLLASLQYLIKRDKRIKRCSNCHKIFVPEHRIDASYCTRPSPQDPNKSCRRFGPDKQYHEKVNNDDTLRLYKKVSSKLQMRYLRADDSVKSKYNSDLHKFRQQANEWKRMVKDGSANFADYIDWLQSIDGKED